MRRRRVIVLSFILIAFVFAALFVLSNSAALSPFGIARDDWLLAGVVLAAVLAGLAALNDIWEFTLKLFGRPADSGNRDLIQERRNRRQLIQNVKATWLQGVREQALHESVWIELGMELEPAQVNRPWPMTWQPDPDTQPQPTSKDIYSIFCEQAANTLLILGEPGSGKTVTLLDLALELLDEAEKADDLTTPIPVVFNLSSWAQKRQSLHDWLLDELDRTYSVPEKTAQYWLEADALILLLDGLDEVAAAHRDACVEAINVYRQAHGLTGITVCSRIKEYKTLTTRLNLTGAVVIQPLAVDQADRYLQKMGQELWTVRELLQEDDDLQKWVQSPLFLYVVAMAYRRLSLDELRREHNGSLERLYDRYVTQMLQRHRPYQKPLYSPEQTRKWLAYLAGRLSERNLTVYYIEQMQPDWLGEQLNRQKKDKIAKELKSLGEEEITIEDRQWSWLAVMRWVKEKIKFVLFVGLIGGLVLGLPAGRNAGLKAGLSVGLFTGLIVVLFGVLVGGMEAGLVRGDVREHEKPNQGVRRSLMNGLLLGLLVGLLVALFGALAGGLLFGLIYGLIIVLSIVLFSGRNTYLRHFTLRRLMAYFDYLPWRLVPFLEYAKERLLLRRVGGGYVFIHRTLQDYFSLQDKKYPDHPTASGSQSDPTIVLDPDK